LRLPASGAGTKQAAAVSPIADARRPVPSHVVRCKSDQTSWDVSPDHEEDKNIRGRGKEKDDQSPRAPPIAHNPVLCRPPKLPPSRRTTRNSVFLSACLPFAESLGPALSLSLVLCYLHTGRPLRLQTVFSGLETGVPTAGAAGGGGSLGIHSARAGGTMMPLMMRGGTMTGLGLKGTCAARGGEVPQTTAGGGNQHMARYGGYYIYIK
jgi:hypothetical protein